MPNIGWFQILKYVDLLLIYHVMIKTKYFFGFELVVEKHFIDLMLSFV